MSTATAVYGTGWAAGHQDVPLSVSSTPLTPSSLSTLVKSLDYRNTMHFLLSSSTSIYLIHPLTPSIPPSTPSCPFCLLPGRGVSLPGPRPSDRQWAVTGSYCTPSSPLSPQSGAHRDLVRGPACQSDLPRQHKNPPPPPLHPHLRFFPPSPIQSDPKYLLFQQIKNLIDMWKCDNTVAETHCLPIVTRRTRKQVSFIGKTTVTTH